VPEYHCWAEPPQGWSWRGVSWVSGLCSGQGAEGGGTYSDNDGGVVGEVLGHVDVHLDRARVAAEAVDLLE